VRELIKNHGRSNNLIFDNYEHVKREDMNYNPETDIILCSTNRFGDYWTGRYGETKWRVTDNTRTRNNGDIVCGESPEGVKCEARHGFTIHSVQGETFKGTISIDSRRWFEPTMGYTAISRAREYGQVKIID